MDSNILQVRPLLCPRSSSGFSNFSNDRQSPRSYGLACPQPSAPSTPCSFFRAPFRLQSPPLHFLVACLHKCVRPGRHYSSQKLLLGFPIRVVHGSPILLAGRRAHQSRVKVAGASGQGHPCRYVLEHLAVQQLVMIFVIYVALPTPASFLVLFLTPLPLTARLLHPPEQGRHRVHVRAIFSAHIGLPGRR